jgi:hypothetical protein
MNIETATFRGAEASLRGTVAAIALTARASLIGFSAEEAAGTVSKYALRPLARSFSLELNAPIAGTTSVSLRGAHFARAAADPEASADDWSLIDARISTSWRGVTLFGDVTNITDSAWDDVTGEPAPGRAFSAGVRVRR